MTDGIDHCKTTTNNRIFPVAHYLGKYHFFILYDSHTLYVNEQIISNITCSRMMMSFVHHIHLNYSERQA